MTTTSRLSVALADRYRIDRELGQGGMATVYLAHDVRHDRDVAVKVLHEDLGATLGPERFLAEIKTTAKLHHPHILPLLDSGEAGGLLFYVMPFVAGETLRERLTRDTQLPVDEAVRLAREVADALGAAHAHGIIHRDIKPENILLQGGHALVADFGIALAVQHAGGQRMTQTGLSLGTPQYMAPEQAMGDKTVDHRADIYALGAVTYEMLTGDPPFTGSSIQAIVAKVVSAEPERPTLVRKTIPPAVEAAVLTALAKLPADRFESAMDFAAALKNPTFAPPSANSAQVSAGATRWRQHAAVPLALLSFLLLGAAGWAWFRPEPAAPVTRLDLALGVAVPLPSSDVVISPDGSMLAYVGTVGSEQAIYVRHLGGDPDFRKVPGTEGVNASPTFSPDSRSLAFRRTGDALLKVSVSGGGTTTLARLDSEIGAFLHWGTDDQIVYSGGPQGLFLVAAAGGPPRFLPRTDGAARYSFLLPDASGVLFSRAAGVFLLDFGADSATLLIPNAVHPTYVATGHLLYIAETGGLFAVPFDLGSHRVTGSPVRVIDRVAAATGRRGYSVSRNGVLVYHEGAAELQGGAAVPTYLAIASFTGAADTLRLPRGRRLTPRFSPDGRSIAFEGWANREADFDIHTYELASGTDTRITFEGSNTSPVWSPDGTRILFGKRAPGGRDLFVKPADNSGAEQSLLSMPGGQSPNAWLAETIVFASTSLAGQSDLFTYSYPAKDGAAPAAYLATPWAESDAHISPDGKLAVFTSAEARGQDVWISDFPVARGKWQVSSGGGIAPRWSPDGQLVYFWRRVALGGDSLFRARVDRTPAVVVRAPEFILALDVQGSTNSSWDLHPDGKRFVVVLPRAATPASASTGADAAPASRYLVVLNWFAEFRALTTSANR